MRQSRIAVNHLRIEKFFSFVQGIHFPLQSPDQRQELINRRKFVLLGIKFICSQLSSSSRLFSCYSQFSNNLMHDSLDKIYFSSSIILTFCGIPFELDKPTGLHDETLNVVIEVDC